MEEARGGGEWAGGGKKKSRKVFCCCPAQEPRREREVRVCLCVRVIGRAGSQGREPLYRCPARARRGRNGRERFVCAREKRERERASEHRRHHCFVFFFVRLPPPLHIAMASSPAWAALPGARGVALVLGVALVARTAIGLHPYSGKERRKQTPRARTL